MVFLLGLYELFESIVVPISSPLLKSGKSGFIWSPILSCYIRHDTRFDETIWRVLPEKVGLLYSCELAWNFSHLCFFLSRKLSSISQKNITIWARAKFSWSFSNHRILATPSFINYQLSLRTAASIILYTIILQFIKTYLSIFRAYQYLGTGLFFSRVTALVSFKGH